MNISIFHHPILKRALPYILLVWTLIILYLTMAPSDTLPDSVIFDYDKLGHLAVFGGWTMFVGLFILVSLEKLYFPMKWIALSGFLFGGLIEILQYVTPFNRSASWADAVANGIGCAFAYFVLRYIQNDMIARNKPESVR